MSAPDAFVISHETPAPQTSLLRPQGELDVLTAPQLKEAISATLEAGNDRLAIDLQKVSFIDSTTLGVLIGALKHIRAADGRMVLVCHDPAILKLIQITGLHRVFEIRADVDAALVYLETGESTIEARD